MQADANFNPTQQIYQARAGQRVRPVLSVDLDNVLRDQIGSIIETVWRRYGRRLTREMFSCWDPPLGGLIGMSDEEFTGWAWSDPAIFVEARPVTGAALALLGLRTRYRIVITTATACPHLSEPWLKWWRIPYDQVIHTSDKGSVAFAAHIDDSPGTLQTLAGAGRRVIRFDLPWNRHLVGLPALTQWTSQVTL